MMSNLQLFQAIGFPLMAIMRTISQVSISVILSMGYSMKITFVFVVALPLSLLAVILDSRRASKMAITEKESLEVGIKIASEAICNIRTVASLSMRNSWIAKWNENNFEFDLI